MSKKSLTLLEILISIIILSLVLVSMTNLFIAGKKWLRYARSRMTGGELGRLFLDPLQGHVRQDTWNSNALNVATSYCDSSHPTQQNPVCPSQPSDRTLGGTSYDAQFDITALSNIRKVVVTIRWSEPTLP